MNKKPYKLGELTPEFRKVLQKAEQAINGEQMERMFYECEIKEQTFREYVRARKAFLDVQEKLLCLHSMWNGMLFMKMDDDPAYEDDECREIVKIETHGVFRTLVSAFKTYFKPPDIPQKTRRSINIKYVVEWMNAYNRMVFMSENHVLEKMISEAYAIDVDGLKVIYE